MADSGRRTQYTLLLAYLFFFCVLSNPVISEEKDIERIQVWRDQVPVIESNRPLITGIDLDKVFSRYLADYDAFERSPMGPYEDGIVWKWRVKPDPKDPETRYFWGKKRSEPYYQRFVRLTIGVFPSHRDAIIAIPETDIQEVPRLNPIDPDDPGFVSWNSMNPNQFSFIRDNVYVAIQIDESLNPQEMAKQLDRDLKNGAEGIFKGKTVVRPIIDGSDFTDQVSFWVKGKTTAALRAIDPDKRELIGNVWVNDINRSLAIPVDETNVPIITWIRPDLVEIKHRGQVSRAAEVCAIVVNDRCVVSEVWKKIVTFSVPKSESN